MGQLSNISVARFRKFLEGQGLSYSHTSGGHEFWSKPGLLRPVTFQTHIDPIPEFIIKNNLRTMDVDRKTLVAFLNQ